MRVSMLTSPAMTSLVLKASTFTGSWCQRPGKYVNKRKMTAAACFVACFVACCAVGVVAAVSAAVAERSLGATTVLVDYINDNSNCCCCSCWGGR